MRDEKRNIRTPLGPWLQVHVARRFSTRLRGLMGQRKGSKPRAMLFPDCGRVHMGFMHVPVDIVYLHSAEAPVVLAIETARPWHPTHAPKGCGSVLELPCGWADFLRIEPGLLLDIEPTRAEGGTR